MTAGNDSLTDAAGTAIVSISTITPSVHVMVVFTGILSGKRQNDNTVVLRLFAEDKPTAVFEEVSERVYAARCINIVVVRAHVSARRLDGWRR